MSAPRNFDPVAHLYDDTRILPEPVLRAGIPAIMDLAGPGGRLLDAGTGTGRIAVPLLARGADVTGVDISLGMMSRQRAKFPAARLACASLTQLPFGDGRFDAVLTTHVLHLIPDWQAALAEFKRVMRPGGLHLDARSETNGDSPMQRSRDFWRDWLRDHGKGDHGGKSLGERPGAASQATLVPALAALGATVETIAAVTYPTTYTLRQRVEGIRDRAYSTTWDIPADLLAASADALEAWAATEYGGLDVELADEQVFLIQVARFPA